MPYDDPSPDDPMLLVGTTVEAGPQADLEMAYAFAEEFARMGYDEERLFRLFEKPFYAGAHRVFRSLGESRIRRIIREVVGVWGRAHVGVHDTTPHPPEPAAMATGSPPTATESRSPHVEPLGARTGFVRLRLPETTQCKGGPA